MKRLLTFFWISFFSMALYAHDEAEDTSCASSSFLYIGGNYTRAYIKPNAFASFQGNLGGLQGLYEYKPQNFVYAGLKLAWRYGSTHAGNGKRTLLDVNVHERLGYTFGFDCCKSLLTLFTGFGYRHLSHDVKQQKMKAVKLRYNEFYVPVGFLTQFRVNSFFLIGLNGTWSPQVFPTVTVDSLKGARWELQETYKNFLVELPLTFNLSKPRHLSLVLSPFFECWHDGHTSAKTSSGLSMKIPRNTYIFWGADLNLKYSF